MEKEKVCVPSGGAPMGVYSEQMGQQAMGGMGCMGGMGACAAGACAGGAGQLGIGIGQMGLGVMGGMGAIGAMSVGDVSGVAENAPSACAAGCAPLTNASLAGAMQGGAVQGSAGGDVALQSTVIELQSAVMAMQGRQNQLEITLHSMQASLTQLQQVGTLQHAQHTRIMNQAPIRRHSPDTWQVAASQSYMLQQRELASAASPDGGGLGPAKRKAEEALEGEDAKRAAS